MSDGAKKSVELAERIHRWLTAAIENEAFFAPPLSRAQWKLIATALRATPPAAPAGGERETALRDQVFKTIEVLQSPDVTMDSEFRSFTAKQLQKALDYAAPAQSIEDEGEREAAIERIMSIRNGMTSDQEARAIIRRELTS